MSAASGLLDRTHGPRRDDCVSIPLGERLVWREGDVVALELDVTLPWDATRKTVKRELRGVLVESSGTKLDALVSQ